ncbi:uncharacterized protein LOC127712740 [Mytilus californianus]|uniref:uncharacterized protein LOC127712740 n=1 Tax=Mytilus californianus TaxID=6549 RepID=UPI0022461C2E|nr:uncharacterized protein LOC127712740 [Mytilus californianus]
MMKIVILGLLAALAYAAPPMRGMGMGMGMPPMMMPPMMMGGMLPPEALDMLKDLKPNDIKEAIKNMPPQMKSMMQGMGISEDQINEAVKSLPEDLTPLVEQMKEKLENHPEEVEKVMAKVELPEEMQANMKESALGILKGRMQEMGMDIKEDEDMSSVMEKAKSAIANQLKEDGFDLNDPEGMQAKMMAEMRKITNASPDESDEEVKIKVAKDLLEQMKENGHDVDPEKPQEAMEKLKTELKSQLKSMDIEIDEEDLNANDFKAVLQKIIATGKLGNPMHLMMSAMATFSSGEIPHGGPMPPPMMMPQEMPHPQGGYRMQPLNSYVEGAEDALVHVFGDDDEVIQNLMEIKAGAMRGVLPEQALFRLMKDLMHYRLEARVLIAQNRILEEKLAASQFHAMPPFARSPFALRVLGCRHHH